jgi:hypothetical protein
LHLHSSADLTGSVSRSGPTRRGPRSSTVGERLRRLERGRDGHSEEGWRLRPSP